MKAPLIAPALLLLLSSLTAYAQIDLQCNGRDAHSIYLHNGTGFYRIDSVDTAPTNPIQVAGNNSFPAGGISINANLNGGTPSPALYFFGNNINIHYWNGLSWVNTGHTNGISGNINPGGTSTYIYGFVGVSNTVWRYDGTANPQLFVSNTGVVASSVYDLATDSIGNFYLFYSGAGKIMAYSPNGIAIDSFTTSGFSTSIECGFTIVGNRFYATICNGVWGLYEGIVSGSTVNFTLIKPLPSNYIDIASCPSAAYPLAVFKNPKAPHFALYPNPAHTNTTFKLDNTSSIQVFDYMGVLQKNIAVNGQPEYTLDVSKFKPGLYLVTLTSNQKVTASTRLVVE